MKNYFIAFVLSVFLVGCGGGDSSSGGGVANGTSGPTPFTGTYRGIARTSVFYQGESASGEFPATLTIGADGSVNATLEGVDSFGTVCADDPEPTFINGNQIPFDIKGTCFLSGAGNCTIDTVGVVTMSGNSGIGESTGTLDCPTFPGGAGITYSIGVNKI